jgi:hypothetical protein
MSVETPTIHIPQIGRPKENFEIVLPTVNVQEMPVSTPRKERKKVVLESIRKRRTMSFVTDPKPVSEYRSTNPETTPAPVNQSPKVKNQCCICQ